MAAPRWQSRRRTTEDTTRAPRTPSPVRVTPAFVTPMAAQVVKRLPEGDDWIYELKFDGYRALIIKDEQRVELRSRKNKDLTGMYPGIAAAGLRLNADQAVVDGEIVALDAQGSPSFQALQHRGSHPGHQIVFYAFDLLHLDGTDLTGRAAAEAQSAARASARRLRPSAVTGVARHSRSDRRGRARPRARRRGREAQGLAVRARRAERRLAEAEA